MNLGGILYAYIAVKTNSIFPSIICHSVYNTIITVVDQIADVNLMASDIVTYVWFGLATVLSIIILIRSRKKINFPKTTVEKRKRCFPLFITSPVIIITLLALFAFIILNFKFI